MKKINSLLLLGLVAIAITLFVVNTSQENTNAQGDSSVIITAAKQENKRKKTPEEKRMFAIERIQYEFDLLKNPNTGEVLKEDRLKQLTAAREIQSQNINRASSNEYVSRGPSNFGGRTRSLVIDLSDETSNTMIAGGVSSGVFRTTDGGASWTRVSSNNDLHNVTAIAQDPRPGFQNIWYYGTGELAGNSATAGGAFFLGQGVWQSLDGGLNWEPIPETSSVFQNFDSDFDVVHALEVNPVTGDLYIATINSIYNYDGDVLTEVLLADSQNAQTFTDVTIDASGRIYAAIGGDEGNTNGVYLSEDNGASFTRIAQNGNPSGWNATGRTVIAKAPSNDNYLYALFTNGGNSAANQFEADLWRYDRSTNSWEDFTSKLPDLPGGPVGGIDPFAVQGGYDLVVSVSVDDENFVAIGGTSAYRIVDIEEDPEFEQIGGYNGIQAGLYTTANGDIHHPDIHELVFDPFNTNVLFSGTDGGIHRTDNVDENVVDWVNLNNDYQTYQYYDVFLDQAEGSNLVIGGAQDNGTTAGGTDGGLPDNTEMVSVFGGDGVSVGFGRPENGDFIGYMGFQLGGIFRFNFTTQNVVSIRPTTATANGLFVTLFHLDPDNTDNLYYASQNNVYRTASASTVNPGAWDNLGTLPITQRPRSFATTRGIYDENSSYLLIGGQNGSVFRLDDPQNNASLGNAINITPTGASTAAGSIVSALAVHPTNPDIAMAVYSNFGIPSIFVTSDATSDEPTWTLVQRNLALFSIRAAQILEIEGQTQYFVGTARGLYSNLDPLTTDWLPEGVDQIGIPVISDLEYRPSDGTLLIGTHGNGMFETQSTLLSLEDTGANLANNNSLSIFPNPAQEQLNFRFNSPEVRFNNYEITDYTGRIIERDTFENTSQRSINISNFPTGVYLLRVTTQNNEKIVKRFIKR